MVYIKKTKTTNYEIHQVALEFLPYDESFREIRKGAQYKGENCFSCNKKFEDGEMMSLAIMKKHKNRLICKPCAKQFKNKLEEDIND